MNVETRMRHCVVKLKYFCTGNKSRDMDSRVIVETFYGFACCILRWVLCAAVWKGTPVVNHPEVKVFHLRTGRTADAGIASYIR